MHDPKKQFFLIHDKNASFSPLSFFVLGEFLFKPGGTEENKVL